MRSKLVDSERRENSRLPKMLRLVQNEFSIWVPRTKKLWAVKVTQRNCGLFASW